MALHYGNENLAEGQYDAMPEVVKNLWHNIIPWWLMTTGLPGITEVTLPILYERMRLVDRTWYEDTSRMLMEKHNLSLSEVMKTYFMGYTANVSYETNAEFSKRLFKEKPVSTNKVYASFRASNKGVS